MCGSRVVLGIAHLAQKVAFEKSIREVKSILEKNPRSLKEILKLKSYWVQHLSPVPVADPVDKLALFFRKCCPEFAVSDKNVVSLKNPPSRPALTHKAGAMTIRQIILSPVPQQIYSALHDHLLQKGSINIQAASEILYSGKEKVDKLLKDYKGSRIDTLRHILVFYENISIDSKGNITLVNDRLQISSSRISKSTSVTVKENPTVSQNQKQKVERVVHDVDSEDGVKMFIQSCDLSKNKFIPVLANFTDATCTELTHVTILVGGRDDTIEHIYTIDFQNLSDDSFATFSKILFTSEVIKVVYDVSGLAKILGACGIRFSGILDIKLVYQTLKSSKANTLVETALELQNNLAQNYKRGGSPTKKTEIVILKECAEKIIDELSVIQLGTYLGMSDLIVSMHYVKKTPNVDDFVHLDESESFGDISRRTSNATVSGSDDKINAEVVSVGDGDKSQKKNITEQSCVWFDDKNTLVNVESLQSIPRRLEKARHDLHRLLELIPERFRQKLVDECPYPHDDLIDIVLDYGRDAYASFKSPLGEVNRCKFFTDDSRIFTQEDLDETIAKIGISRFGSDNRAGMNNSLNRISAIRNRETKIIGITLRVGRVVYGQADMIKDIVADTSKSILLLGGPGCGKTTFLRDLVRLASEGKVNVCVVDTSNEIAGDGDIPHECIGDARRVMVRTLNDQHRVMVECVQNHTVNTLVIDEIGRSAEVTAARTVKHRNVRMIASAHGDFQSLMKNPELKGLLGGIENVTFSDKSLKKGESKIQGVRSGAPCFEVVVEIVAHNSIRIIRDTALAVDRVLAGEGRKVKVETRTRDLNGSGMFVSESLLYVDNRTQTYYSVANGDYQYNITESSSEKAREWHELWQCDNNYQLGSKLFSIDSQMHMPRVRKVMLYGKFMLTFNPTRKIDTSRIFLPRDHRRTYPVLQILTELTASNIIQNVALSPWAYFKIEKPMLKSRYGQFVTSFIPKIGIAVFMFTLSLILTILTCFTGRLQQIKKLLGGLNHLQQLDPDYEPVLGSEKREHR
ncbi:Uncharacterized protein HK098_002445 [Nowakowskiella sp. JEL0407]|nr:Uncharacterized protein HK098_002445 [Nowakowskiella sp. JEL0407]